MTVSLSRAWDLSLVQLLNATMRVRLSVDPEQRQVFHTPNVVIDPGRGERAIELSWHEWLGLVRRKAAAETP